MAGLLLSDLWTIHLLVIVQGRGKVFYVGGAVGG